MERNPDHLRQRGDRRRRMRIVIVAFLLLCVGVVAVAPAPAVAGRTSQTTRPIDAALASELEQALAQAARNRDVPGIALAVTIPGYQTWYGTRGVADRRSGARVDPSHRFRVGSLSKMFVATVAMQLVEEGTLDLNAPIGMWLPNVVPGADRMTLRQVMNHTSGLNDYLDNDFMRLALRDRSRVWTPQDLVNVAVRRGPYFQPGAPGRWRYSNTDYVLLGILIERVTGNTLAEEIHQRVIGRLKLEQTFFEPDDRVQGPLMRGYAGSGDWTDIHMSYAWGTGSIVSTVEDLTRFAQALFEGRLMKPETLNTMLSFVDAQGSFGMRSLEYGLGVMRYRMEVGAGPGGRPRSTALSTAVGHIGGVGGYRAAVWYLPESKIIIAAGFNEANMDPVPLPNTVLNMILTHQGR